MAQHGKGGFLQQRLQASRTPGVSATCEPSQVPLEVPGRGQQTNLQLADRHGAIRPAIAELGAAASGQGPSLATTALNGIEQQTHHGHQHQEAKQAAAAETEEGNQEGEANAAAAIAAPVATAIAAATAIATPAVAAGHGGCRAETAATDTAAAGRPTGAGMGQQEGEGQHGYNQQAGAAPQQEGGGTRQGALSR